jgi:HPt (histidine-containing phosphotransfer) domain-containing protein
MCEVNHLQLIRATGLDRIAEIRRHAEQHDATGTAEAAHALKGATGILCAESLHRLSADIEQAGRSSHLDDVEDMIRDLAVEMQRCLGGMRRIREEMQLITRQDGN